MMKAKCIAKARDKNNQIIGYKLQDQQGNTTIVKPEAIKSAIRSNKIEVINLTLTSDNRLIDKKPDTVSKPTTTPSLKQNINIENLINKVKTLGYTLNTFDTDCGHKCYIASLSDNTKHVFIIPDDVEYIYETNADELDAQKKNIYGYISNIKGALKVVGGKNLISTRHMFSACKAHSIDLSSFSTSKVTDMGHMFRYCRAESLDLSSFDTSKVTNMEFMFSACKAQSIDLRSFDTSKVTDMYCMFGYCVVQSLDLSSFDISNVTNMSGMFYDCEAQYIDLSSFDTREIRDMSTMFCGCTVQNMSTMFCGCEAQIKVNDPNLKHQLQWDRSITVG